MPDSHETTIRVRYAETDRMGLLHHANYFVYFELARTEMLRAGGSRTARSRTRAISSWSSTWAASTGNRRITTTC